MHENFLASPTLTAVFDKLEPPVPRGFCRPTFNLVLQWRPTESTRQRHRRDPAHGKGVDLP
jgi:hypothetical protein